MSSNFGSTILFTDSVFRISIEHRARCSWLNMLYTRIDIHTQKYITRMNYKLLSTMFSTNLTQSAMSSTNLSQSEMFSTNLSQSAMFSTNLSKSAMFSTYLSKSTMFSTNLSQSFCIVNNHYVWPVVLCSQHEVLGYVGRTPGDWWWVRVTSPSHLLLQPLEL